MKYLESVKLVQFFLIESADIQLKEITGVFGPNASGKSTLIDAVQIAMFGGNARLVNLNAQADEKSATTRSIRSYCLGMHDETKRARDNATTYITMIWRDSETNEPTSMGVCIYASTDTDGHDVRGRYIIPGLELAMHDHLEMVDGDLRPRAWETFRHQLIQRSKATGEDPFYADSERYIKAALLALRGSGGAPSTEAFKSAFRFALRMRFDKSVDHIVRNDVLETRPTNIQRFREVLDSFTRLSQMIDQVKAKIEDGERVESEFSKAAALSIRAVTWKGLSCLAGRQSAQDELNREAASKRIAEQVLASLIEEHAKTDSALQHARSEEKRNRDLRINHAAHKEHGALRGDISKASETENKKAHDIRNGLKLVVRTLTDAANSPHLKNNSAEIKSIVSKVDSATSTAHELSKEQLSSVLKPALKEASRAVNALFEAGSRIMRELSDTETSLKAAEIASKRANEGRARLSDETEKLLAELNNHGIQPTPVCDLVKITDPQWQPVIEAYLGRNAEALLVEKKDEDAAFSIYRGMTGARAVYGAKVVAASKQASFSADIGTVADLIQGDHPGAVSYLRRRFGDMLLADTDAEALSGKRTLTKDGMIVQHGEYDRIRPMPESLLKIGGSRINQKEQLAQEILQLNRKLQEIKKQQADVKALMEALGNIASEATVMKFMLDACEEMHTSRGLVASLSQRLSESADAEYIRLGELEQSWEKKAQELQPAVDRLQNECGRAQAKVDESVIKEDAASVKLQEATAAADIAVADKEYDGTYSAEQWNVLLGKFDNRYQEMIDYCLRQMNDADRAMQAAIRRGSAELGTFREKYREQGSLSADEWRGERDWMNALLTRLRETELVSFQAQMNDAVRASQETFRQDVAIALSNNIDHLNTSMNRLNHVLSTCPVFSNGERYRFQRTVRPQLKRLLNFIQDVAVHGPNDDLLGGPGEMPEEFLQLLKERVTPGAAGVQSALDDYREFFEFDIEILREDSLTHETRSIGSLSKRLGTGSGGEHRAPLYVIAGAALASAYRLDSGNADGIRLILLDEAFNKMDTANIVATMRYLEQLGLQIFMASPGDNLGTLTAFLHRYYDILRDVDNGTVLLQGHDISESVREMFRSDLPEFNEELIAEELAAIRAGRGATTEAIT